MIHKSAYLSVCPECGEHCRIVLKDGTYSRVLYSKEDARLEVSKLLQLGKIEKDESMVIDSAISTERRLAPSRKVVSIDAVVCDTVTELVADVMSSLENLDCSRLPVM